MRIARLARWAALGALLGASACQTTSQTTGPSIAASPEKALDPAPEASLGGTPEVPTGLESVYFDYDRWELRDDARRILKENARRIQATAGGEMLVVEGHCDERGNDEYNLALGERRAQTVARYLEDLGVPASHLRTLSFGESQPAATGHDESAWRLNRRSEIRVESRSASR